MVHDRLNRILLVAEELSSRPDEAALRTLSELLRYCSGRHATLVLHARGEVPDGIQSRKIPFTRAGITPALWTQCRDWGPDLVIYVPSASLTANALYRSAWLRASARCPVAVVGFQRRRFGPVARAVVRFFEPDAVVVNSEATGSPFRQLGWTVIRMELGVNTDRFRPISAAERVRLRAELGWEVDLPVVLHVGHLRAGRGLDRLRELAAAGRHRVVMVASLSERGEEELAVYLTSSGVELHHDYIERIERYYQASDLYLFPVMNETSAIDLPLSVLEALACELSVLTTRHGALPDRLRDSIGVHWIDPHQSIVDQVDKCLASPTESGRIRTALGWETVFDQLFSEIRTALR